MENLNSDKPGILRTFSAKKHKKIGIFLLTLVIVPSSLAAYHFKSQSANNVVKTNVEFAEEGSIYQQNDTNVSLNVQLSDITYRNLMKIKKPDYLPNYKAPCIRIAHDELKDADWLSKSGVTCLPAVYLAGQPKSGSSDLYELLCRHPDVIRTPKEPQYWSRHRFLPEYEHLSNYLALYKSASDEIYSSCIWQGEQCFHRKIFMDGSVSLFWDNTNANQLPANKGSKNIQQVNAHHIHHLTPDVKIIVIFRNPVDREYSSYLYFTRENKSPEDFHQKVVWSVRQFQDCAATWSPRLCAYNKTIMKILPIRMYIGLYSIFVSDWLKAFPRKQLYFLRLEDYKLNRQLYAKKLFEFIGLGSSPSWFDKLASNKPVSNTRRAADQTVGPMLNKTRIILQKFYAPFNRQLANILNNNDFLYS